MKGEAGEGTGEAGEAGGEVGEVGEVERVEEEVEKGVEVGVEEWVWRGELRRKTHNHLNQWETFPLPLPLPLPPLPRPHPLAGRIPFFCGNIITQVRMVQCVMCFIKMSLISLFLFIHINNPFTTPPHTHN